MVTGSLARAIEEGHFARIGSGFRIGSPPHGELVLVRIKADAGFMDALTWQYSPFNNPAQLAKGRPVALPACPHVQPEILFLERFLIAEP